MIYDIKYNMYIFPFLCAPACIVYAYTSNQKYGQWKWLTRHTCLYGVAVLYMSTHPVTVHDEEGMFLFAFGSKGSGPGCFDIPRDVTFVAFLCCYYY